MRNYVQPLAFRQSNATCSKGYGKAGNVIRTLRLQGNTYPQVAALLGELLTALLAPSTKHSRAALATALGRAARKSPAPCCAHVPGIGPKAGQHPDPVRHRLRV